ncbi:hypothetical protein ACUSMT_005349, partial [Escherichia coli]
SGSRKKPQPEAASLTHYTANIQE